MTPTPAPGFAALVLVADSLGNGAEPIALGRWGSTTVVEHLVSVIGAAFAPVVVVLGCDGDRVLERADLGDALVVIDPEWSEGIASPLRAGLDTLSRQPDVDHAVIVDAMIPQIDAGLLDQLIEAHRTVPHALQGRRLGDKSATVARFRYARSGPIVVARDLWERFLSMEGATPILQTLSAHPDWINEVWIDQLPPAEVHTAGDLARVAPRH